MSLRRKIARGISEANALARHFMAPRPGLRILMYHAIGSHALGDQAGLFTLSPELFKLHAKFLAQQAMGKIVPLQESIDYAQPSTKIAITFDDGYQDNLDVAAPILADFGLPFTVFVTSSFVKQAHAGFLSPTALRTLASIPDVTIGAHGDTHIPLTQCDDSTLESELTSSKHYLEDILGKSVLTMAYPYGAVDRRVRDAAQRAGYQLAACSHVDINKVQRDKLLLARNDILNGDSVRVLGQKIRGDWDWYRWRTADPAYV